MQCPSCQKENAETRAYCIYCGAALKAESSKDGSRIRTRKETGIMNSFTNPGDKALENLTHGQNVIITARWLLILSGWMLVLWQPELFDLPGSEIGKLALQVGVLFAISIGNFFLTIHFLKGSQSLPAVVFATSAGDFAVITILIMALGGYFSSLYVFYFPALLAVSVAFPTSAVLLYSGVAIGVYGLIAVSTAGGTVDSVEAQNILMRLILMAAVAYCGDRYRRLEEERERRTTRPSENPQ